MEIEGCYRPRGHHGLASRAECSCDDRRGRPRCAWLRSCRSRRAYARHACSRARGDSRMVEGKLPEHRDFQAPHDAKYIGTFDADIHFRKSGWTAEAIHALQLYPVAQPWKTVYDLGPNDDHIHAHVTFASGNVSKMIDCCPGCRPPPKKPCSSRKMMSCDRLSAIPQRREQTVNIDRQIRK